MKDTQEMSRESSWAELRPFLDRELTSLAEKYRTAIVLCDLESKSRQEAARLLGIAVEALDNQVRELQAVVRRLREQR